MDTPRLMVEIPGTIRLRDASVEDVLAWLRQQGAIDYEAADAELEKHVAGEGNTQIGVLRILEAALGSQALRVEGDE